MNNEIQEFARAEIKEGLAKLPESNRLFFRSMYSHGDIKKSMSDIVDEMEPEKLDWAMQQVGKSLVIFQKKRAQSTN